MKVRQGRLKEKKVKSYWETLLESNLGYKSKPSRDKIFGSNAGLCARQTAGMILLDDDFVNHVGPSSEFYFKIGQGFEKVVKKALKNSGVRFADELSVTGQMDTGLPKVSGRVDFTVERDGELVLIELKSCGKLPDRPKLYHLEQLKTYMLMSGINKGVLWYISRNVANYKGELQMAIFEVEPTEEHLYEVALTIATGSLGAVQETLPQIPPHMKKYKCGFCPLVKKCWDGGEIKMKGNEADTARQLELEAEAKVVADNFMLTRPQLAKDFWDYFQEEAGDRNDKDDGRSVYGVKSVTVPKVRTATKKLW